jgi:hypothetical protein
MADILICHYRNWHILMNFTEVLRDSDVRSQSEPGNEFRDFLNKYPNPYPFFLANNIIALNITLFPR